VDSISSLEKQAQESGGDSNPWSTNDNAILAKSAMAA